MLVVDRDGRFVCCGIGYFREGTRCLTDGLGSSGVCDASGRVCPKGADKCVTSGDVLYKISARLGGVAMYMMSEQHRTWIAVFET